MRQRMKSFPLSACALTTALLVSACGGGSSSPPASATSSSGFAVDGYLSAATVICDANSNGSADTGEATVSTDSSGFFKFTPACSAPLVVTGGTNVDTRLPFTGKLKAPAGSTVVSPLTTLLSEGMTSEQIAKSLGLAAGIDFSNTDPSLAKDGAPVNADLLKKTLAVQQLAQKTTEVLDKLANPISVAANPARPAIFSEVMAGMAAEMRRGVVLVSGTTADESVVAALVKAASQRVGVSTILSTEVKAGAKAVNADGLGKVMAGGLKAQIESILKSANSSAGITAATKTAQSDTQIATFVQTNRAMLVSPPDAGTTTLAATLASQVMASMGGGGVTPGPVIPAPTTLGTLLVSFDEATPAATGIGAFEGALPAVEPGPTGGAANALKIVKPTNPNLGTFGGTYFTVAAIPFTADRKKITARVYATRANAAIEFKVESANGGPAIKVEVAVPGAANTWQTVTWDLAGVDVTKAYTVIAITPDPMLATTGQTYYVDEITLAPAGAVTPPPPTPTPLPICAAPNCVNFSAAGIGFGVFQNVAGTVAIANDPTDAANKVVKFLKTASDFEYFGTTITGLGGSVVLTPTAKTVTMRVFSPDVGTNFLLKFEGGTGGPATTEKDMVTTKANAWETLSFVMPDAGTYTTVVLFPNGRSLVSADKIMYVDDLTFPAFTATTPGTGGTFTGGIFADDYVGILPTAKSTQGGDVGFYYDPRFNYAGTATAQVAYTYGGVTGTAQDALGVHNFYYGIGLNAPAITDGYFGAFIKSPGNGVVNVAGFTNIKVNVWGNEQLFKAGTFPALNVVLQGPPVAGCASASGGSEVQRTFATTTQGAASVYNLPLSSFTIRVACSGETTVAQVLGNITQFNINLLNTNIQYVNKDTGNVAFANGLNIGSIKFD